MSWRPILEGADRDRALETIRAIAEVLRTYKDEHEPPHAALAGGAAGKAIFYAYAGQAELGSFEPAEEFLGRAVDAVAEQPMRPDLYGGFTGIAWTAEHLQGGPDAEEDANEAIDGALLEHVQTTPWRADYDLIVGLVGFGVYAMERIHRETARQIAAAVIDRLDEISVPMDKGLSWLTGSHLMIPETAKLNPEGYYNAGLAHGVPGVIALCAWAAEAGIATEKATRLARGAVDWILSLRRSAPDQSEFPYAIPKHTMKEEHVGCRAAWCYGDPGLSVALLWAARALRDPAWEDVALSIGRQTAGRAIEDAGAIDAGICHGAAGLALIYNRFYQATDDEFFKDRAIAWYRRTLDMRKDKGLAGYQSWIPMGADMKLGWGDDDGLLTGITGIGLTLLSGVTDIEPKWDRMLLTSVPPK